MYPARLNRPKALAATAVGFVLVVVCTAGSLAKAEAPEITTQPSSESAAAPPAAVLTLGDVRFASGRAELKPVAIGDLNKLVNFLTRYRDPSVAIQGYTDSVGNEEHNQELSERRADSVKAYLVARGIDAKRLFVAGMGESNPVAGNDSRAGRQQNRRAELIISNAPAVLSQRPRTTKMMILLMLLESVNGHSGRPFL